MNVIQLQAAPIEDWTSGDWKSAMFDPLVNLIGEGLFSVLLVGTLVTVFFIAGDRGISAPTVLLMLLMPFALALLPGMYLAWADAVVIVGLTVAIWTAYRRFALA